MTQVGPAPAGEGRDSPRDPADRMLLAKHIDGDPEAFGELVSRHRDRLWAVALRTMGNPEDAADALQDGLLNAFRRAASYRGDAAVTTWLHRIIVNACLDRVRRAAARPSAPLDDEDDRSRAIASTQSDPADEASRRVDVGRALAQLPPEQRIPLVLVDMEGYPVAEAAQILGIPTGTVKSRCARGRARLLPLLSSAMERNPEQVLDVTSRDSPSDDPTGRR